jgi:hypothetical protein
MSVDFRLQPMSEPVSEAILPGDYPRGLPHGLTWAEIYRACPDTPDKFFWKERCPTVLTAETERSREYVEASKEERALSQLRDGDLSALEEVKRVRAHSIDITRRIKAKKLLAAIG